MDKRFKKYVVIVLLVGIGLFAGQIGILFWTDPLQIFHKPWIRKNYYIDELRFQAAGIINNTDFDSIIIGDSMAANFSPKEASFLWNSTFINISVNGSLLSERTVLLDYLFRKRNIENAIFSLNGFSEFGKYKFKYPIENFGFLYNTNPFDDIKVYCNLKFMKYSLCGYLIDLKNPICEDAKDLETLTEWGSLEEHRKRFGGIENWFKAKNNKQIIAAFRSISEKAEKIKRGEVNRLEKEEYKKELVDIKKSLDHYVIRFAKENPDTQFYLYFPPFSRINYAIMKQLNPDKFELYLQKMLYVVKKTKGLENMTVFGFDHLDFLDDIANYKDPGHHHPKFNSEILNWMKNKNHVLSTENVHAHISQIAAKAAAYDVLSLAEKINAYIRNGTE